MEVCAFGSQLSHQVKQLPPLLCMDQDFTGKSVLSHIRWLCPSVYPETALLLFGLRMFGVSRLVDQSEHVEDVWGQNNVNSV